jgi:cyclic beta-1,2-glucan synthetase
MSKFDWTQFFESVSLVDEALRATSHFGAMDFATRDRYRHEIEDLARGAKRSELDVTRQAIARAHGAAPAAPPASAPPGDRFEDPVTTCSGAAGRSSSGKSLPFPSSGSCFAPLSLAHCRGILRGVVTSCSWPSRAAAHPRA